MAIPNYGFQPQQVQQPFVPQQQVQQVPLAQMPVQQVQKTYLLGKYIQSETDILPSDVPIDDNRHYFPSADESFIIVKFWDANSNGRMLTHKYVLEESATPLEQPDILNNINQRFDKLEQLISGKPKFVPNQKKEVQTNA